MCLLLISTQSYNSCNFVLFLVFRNKLSVLVNLAQLIWTMHNVCKIRGSNPGYQKKKKQIIREKWNFNRKVRKWLLIYIMMIEWCQNSSINNNNSQAASLSLMEKITTFGIYEWSPIPKGFRYCETCQFSDWTFKISFFFFSFTYLEFIVSSCISS